MRSSVKLETEASHLCMIDFGTHFEQTDALHSKVSIGGRTHADLFSECADDANVPNAQMTPTSPVATVTFALLNRARTSSTILLICNK